MKNKVCYLCGLEVSKDANNEYICVCGQQLADDSFNDLVTLEYDSQFHIYKDINDLPVKN